MNPRDARKSPEFLRNGVESSGVELMRIVGKYSFKGGDEYVRNNYSNLLAEVMSAIEAVDAEKHKTKESEEATMLGRLLYSPPSLNSALKVQLYERGWASRRLFCEYSTEHYEPGYTPRPLNKGAFREIDFVKSKLGLEVQFGKYAFMVYNVCAKMTIFSKEGLINAGIEIVPVKDFVDEMSSGVSYFEQIVWDLTHRGEADIDIPVLILGIGKDKEVLGRHAARPPRLRKGARPGPKPARTRKGRVHRRV